MSTTSDKTDRQLLEEIHVSQITHDAKHETLDPLIDKLVGAVWGNGRVGLTAKVYLLMAVLGVLSVATVGVVADIVLRH